MRGLQLTPPQQALLEQQLNSTRDAAVYRRTLAILEIAAGRPIAEIAHFLHVSRVSVHRWLGWYAQDRDPECLLDQRGGNHPTCWTEELQAFLRETLAQRPDQLGYPATGWTVPLLREYLAHRGGVRLSLTTIRRQLRDLDYVWKRPRYVLDPDPERGKKSPHPLATRGLAAALRQAV